MGLLLPLISLLNVAAALTTSVTIHLPQNPNPFTLDSTTHATLSTLGKYHSTPLTVIDTFVFHNVTPESYLLDVHCPSFVYAPLRIDVKEDGEIYAWETFRGNEWENKGERIAVGEGSAGKAVEVRALGSKVFFIDRPAFSVLSILKNPMILMGLVSMGIFIGMPYLMDNMDPEMRAEFEEQQRKGPMAALMGGGGGGGGGGGTGPASNFDMAAYMAGSKPKESESSSGSSGSKSNGGGQGKSQGVRR